MRDEDRKREERKKERKRLRERDEKERKKERIWNCRTCKLKIFQLITSVIIVL